MHRGGEAVDVGPRPLVGGGELLGRGVAGREDRRHRLRASGDRGARSAEINQDGAALAIEEDIGGLDVAMEEARAVDLLEPVEKGPEDPVEAGGIEGTLSRSTCSCNVRPRTSSMTR